MSALLSQQIEAFCAGLRASGINAVVRRGPQQPRPVQPLPAGFDIDKARADLAALEATAPTPTEYAYTGESAREMAEWRDNLHRHQIDGLRLQIAQWEAKREAA